MATREKTHAAPWEIYRCEGLLLGKKVISVVVGVIIGTHYYKKGRAALWVAPTLQLRPQGYDARELRRSIVRLPPAPSFPFPLRA
jgi:hypothetical protein